jgi:hypothetical protein
MSRHQQQPTEQHYYQQRLVSKRIGFCTQLQTFKGNSWNFPLLPALLEEKDIFVS